MASVDLTSDQQFAPLFADQDEDAILDRWQAWANEGRDPGADADSWTDTREGSHWYVSTTPMRRETARLYDLAGSDVPASILVQWTWGEFLDDQAEVRQIGRLIATAAEGEVQFSGPEGTLIGAGTVVGVEPSAPGAIAPQYQVTTGGTIDVSGVILLPVMCTTAGIAGNVAEGAVTQPITPLPNVTAITNINPIVGGTDTEADEALRARVLDSYAGSAVANILYYKRLALEQNGVGRATVIRAADGPGTIAIILATASGDPVADDVVTAFQALVDPNDGDGSGAGQVGAAITVSSASILDVTVVGTVELEDGYSLDGADATIALQDVLEAVVGAYIDAVEPGQEIVRQLVIAKLIEVRGVHDVRGDLTLNGTAANLAVPTSPPRAPTLHLLTLTVASL